MYLKSKFFDNKIQISFHTLFNPKKPTYQRNLHPKSYQIIYITSYEHSVDNSTSKAINS